MVMVVSLAYLSLGASLTWPSPAVSSLEKDNSTLVGTEIVLSAAEKDMTGELYGLARQMVFVSTFYYTHSFDWAT